MIGEVFRVCLPDSKDPIYLKEIEGKKNNCNGCYFFTTQGIAEQNICSVTGREQMEKDHNVIIPKCSIGTIFIEIDGDEYNDVENCRFKKSSITKNDFNYCPYCGHKL